MVGKVINGLCRVAFVGRSVFYHDGMSPAERGNGAVWRIMNDIFCVGVHFRDYFKSKIHI